MDRRGFLRTLLTGAAGAAAAHTLDLDRLLWVPGARTFFLPSIESPWGDGNNYLTIEKIVRDALRVLQQNLQAGALVNREYDPSVQETILTVHKPMRYVEDRVTGIRVRIPDWEIARQYREGMSPPSDMTWIAHLEG